MEAGARLGHYELVEQIGEGGMGVVWRALDERLGRDVAVKVLPDELAQDPERLARFEREAQAVAALNHPNIVTIHSVEEHDGLRFITMELVKGRSLRALIPPGGVTTHELIERALPLLDALAQAHAQGITHRDLKPDNVMVDDDGRLKILDFGLAKTAAPPPEDEADAETLMTTGAGTVVGTPHYMSPEQAKGQAVDERSDLFSVGVMLHEMATGKRPFEGDSAVEVLSSILRDPAPEVGELQPAHPKQLSRIVRSCLEKEPDRRCQTARSLGAQLESLRDELSATGSRGGGLRWAAVALIVVLAGLFVAQVAQRPGESAEAAPPAAEESEPRRASLAVLPFVNVTGGEENEYFSDGITDELINALGRVEGLRIPARTTVFTLKGQSLTVGEVGDRLGVEHVLEGTVRKAGDRIRISVQLVNAGDGFEVWSGSFERDYGDVFALQEEIARSLVSSLQVRLVGDGDVRLLGSMTTNLEAYDLYLRAIYELYRGVEPGLRNAVELFGQAIEKDPGHARSWVGLARAHYLLANTYDRPRDRIPLARQAVEEALQLDPNLAEAHAVLGAIHLEFDWDWSAARQRADRAIELDPYDANGRQLLGWVLISQGEFEQGVAEVQRAEELDPFSTQRLFSSAIGYYMASRFEEAARTAESAVRLNDEDPRGYLMLALSLLFLGDTDGAIEAGRRAAELERTVDALEFLGMALAAAGQVEEARELRDEVLEMAEERYTCPYEVASLLLSLGEVDEALAWFEKAIDERADCFAWGNVDPRLEQLRKDPRFVEQLRRVGHDVTALQ